MVEVHFNKSLSVGKNIIPRKIFIENEDFYVDQRGFLRISFPTFFLNVPFSMVENWSRQLD